MFIKRDSQGRIIAVSVFADNGFDEQLNADNHELKAFMRTVTDEPVSSSAVSSNKAASLQSSDTELARVLEDMIDLLTAKGIFQFTELPQAAQEKLLARKNLRQRIRKLDLLGDDDEGIMP